ncbi:plant expansin [Mycena rebaudengoi]|nr:plant expansin [Mycena rebaudengoi]
MFNIAGFMLTIFVLALCVSSAPVEKRSRKYSGDGTFFQPGLGACGVTNTEDQLIVAVGHGVFDSYPGANRANPNKNPICGKKLKASYKGKQVVVTVQDKCPGCAGPADLDFTAAGFKKLADLSVGRLSNVKWEWV